MAWILPPKGGIVARILVVEDSPDNMKLFRTLLALKGHEVTGLTGGDGLLETIARADPELVLMDIQLPGRTVSHCSARSGTRPTQGSGCSPSPRTR